MQHSFALQPMRLDPPKKRGIVTAAQRSRPEHADRSLYGSLGILIYKAFLPLPSFRFGNVQSVNIL